VGAKFSWETELLERVPNSGVRGRSASPRPLPGLPTICRQVLAGLVLLDLPTPAFSLRRALAPAPSPVLQAPSSSVSVSMFTEIER